MASTDGNDSIDESDGREGSGRLDLDAFERSDLVSLTNIDPAVVRDFEVPPEVSSVVNYLLDRGNSLPLEVIRELVNRVKPKCQNFSGVVDSTKRRFLKESEKFSFSVLTELTINRSFNSRDIVTDIRLDYYGLEASGTHTLTSDNVKNGLTEFKSSIDKGFRIVGDPGSTLNVPKEVLKEVRLRMSYDYHGDLYDRSFYKAIEFLITDNDVLYILKRTEEGHGSNKEKCFITSNSHEVEFDPHAVDFNPKHSFNFTKLGWSISIRDNEKGELEIKNKGRTPIFFTVERADD